MVRLKDVVITNGDIYHNLYYESTWDELEMICDLEEPELTFYEKHGAKLTPITFKREQVLDIVRDETYENDNFTLVQDIEDENRLVLIYEEDYDDVCYEEESYIVELCNFYGDYFHRVLAEYCLKDEETIVENLSDVCIGYMEATHDMDDANTTDEELFFRGWCIGILAAMYALSYLDEDKECEELRKDVTDIAISFSDFIEHHKDDITIID